MTKSRKKLIESRHREWFNSGRPHTFDNAPKLGVEAVGKADGDVALKRRATILNLGAYAAPGATIAAVPTARSCIMNVIIVTIAIAESGWICSVAG